MPSPTRWPDAALAGLACSMRTFSGPGLLAVRGQISGGPRIGVLLAEAGEIAGDKAPQAPPRTGPPALAGRVASGAYTGHRIAGAPGAAAGALTAAVGTYATWRVRGLVTETTGLPDPVVAVGEDLVAIGLAAIATRPDEQETEHTQETSSEATGGVASEPAPEPKPAPKRSSLARDAGVGLLAGLAGTAAMTIAQGAEFALTDAEPSSSPADVADLIKRRAGRGKLKRRHRRVANQTMHWLYGTSWGVPYGIFAGSTELPPEVSGPAFGLCVWAAALVQEPALGLADVPWRRSLASLGSEALFHVVYGIGAGAAVRALTHRPG